jgi:hypothetical protein
MLIKIKMFFLAYKMLDDLHVKKIKIALIEANYVLNKH